MERGAPWVPAAIWIEQDICKETGELMDDEKIICLLNGLEVNPYKHWTYLANNPITEEQYHQMMGSEARHDADEKVDWLNAEVKW